MRLPLLRLPENLSFVLYQSSPPVFRQPLLHTPVKQKHRCAQHEGHAGGSGVAVGAAVRRVRRGIHLGSESGRIGIVYVRHGSLRGRRLARVCWWEVGCLCRYSAGYFGFVGREGSLLFSGSLKWCLEGRCGRRNKKRQTESIHLPFCFSSG